MPNLDGATVLHLDTKEVIDTAFYAFLDIEGDPIRATTYGQARTFSGTGDPDLDGHIFSPLDARVLSIGDVVYSEGGVEPLTLVLSGLLSLDHELLNTLADKSRWQGRTIRLWMEVRGSGGNVAPYYTGYMMAPTILPSPDSQTIQLRAEYYLALHNGPSNRTYLDQNRFDPADQSAAATIAAANGMKQGPAASVAATPPAGVGSGRMGGGSGGFTGVNGLLREY